MHHPLSKALLRLICFASVAVIGLATVGDALAQNCESMSGPRRTDCFIGRARSVAPAFAACNRISGQERRDCVPTRHGSVLRPAQAFTRGCGGRQSRSIKSVRNNGETRTAEERLRVLHLPRQVPRVAVPPPSRARPRNGVCQPPRLHLEPAWMSDELLRSLQHYADGPHAANSSNNAFASFRSSVSNPSVNQL
jgi:hypothetical protein